MGGAPAVSVLIPVYNGERFLEVAVNSALAQTLGDLEVIIVIDGSPDRSDEVVARIDDPRIRLIRQENRGLAATRNVLAEAARGEFIAFLDQDDLWKPTRLEKQLRLLERAPDVALVYADCDVIDADGRVLGRWSQRSRLHRGDVFEPLLQWNFVPLPTVLMRRDAFQSVGPFLPFKVAEEYDIWLKCAARYHIEFVDEPLAAYRIHPGQFSRHYEVTLAELLTIFKGWADSSRGLRSAAALQRAVASAYYVAGKNAVYLDGDVRKARGYFGQAFRHRLMPVALGFFALSFLGAPTVRTLRRLAVAAVGTYSLSE